jgi:iron complex outermembrane recepter protein
LDINHGSFQMISRASAYRGCLNSRCVQHFKSISLLTLLVSSSSLAEETNTIPLVSKGTDLIHLSLEDLGKIKVTTVSKRAESLTGAAAAIHVITQEDIRRSGITLLPETLRMAPGLSVARANSRKWAISSRGFNNTFANKLLVLMDGRTLYTPLFSGVFWEETDTVLEDLDRIEVIRGPGATLWGANAVNGVINIITRDASETQGTLITGGGGVEERGFGTVRYGGQLSSNAYYRVYSKYSNHDEFTGPDGHDANDSWWMSQTGFRIDWKPSGVNRLTLQGDYYYGDLGGDFITHALDPPRLLEKPLRTKVEGGNLLGRWTHEISDQSEISAQAYYDRTDREFGVAREIRDTIDFEAQHRFHFGERQEIVWGAGYRYSVDDISGSRDFKMEDPSVGLQLFNAFLQDDIAIMPEHLHLTLGTKVEHNDFTGFEVQPTGRLAWTPHEKHTVWAAVSRAVRTPSRVERGFEAFVDPWAALPASDLPLPLLAKGIGNPDFRSEELLAYELGYRVKLHPSLSLDCTAFYNEYKNLQSVVTLPLKLQTTPGPPAALYLELPLTFSNKTDGNTYGFEVAATWEPIDQWRLRAGYSLIEMDLNGPVQAFTKDMEGASPQHQASLWSDLQLSRTTEWGVGVRYVDDLPARLQQVPSYFELDTRLAWNPTQNCEVAIVGRNLLQPHHQEFSPSLIMVRNVEVDRAVYLKVTMRF